MKCLGQALHFDSIIDHHFELPSHWQTESGVKRWGHSHCEALNSTTNKNLLWTPWSNLLAICLVQLKIIFPKNPHLPDKLGEDLVTNAQGRSALLRSPLHPHHSVTSNNTQLPSAIGSPALHCPVPVVQGQDNLLPVDTHLKLIFPSVFLNRLLHLDGQVEMVKSTLAASVMFVFPQFCFCFFFR